RLARKRRGSQEAAEEDGRSGGSDGGAWAHGSLLGDRDPTLVQPAARREPPQRQRKGPASCLAGPRSCNACANGAPLECQYMPPMPPGPPGIAGAFSFSLISPIIASVVSIRP